VRDPDAFLSYALRRLGAICQDEANVNVSVRPFASLREMEDCCNGPVNPAPTGTRKQ